MPKIFNPEIKAAFIYEKEEYGRIFPDFELLPSTGCEIVRLSPGDFQKDKDNLQEIFDILFYYSDGYHQEMPQYIRSALREVPVVLIMDSSVPEKDLIPLIADGFDYIKKDKMDLDLFLRVTRYNIDKGEANRQLRKIGRAVASAGGAVVITDASGRIEYVNPAFTALTGYTLGEMIGSTPDFFSSGDSSRELSERIWKTLSSGEVWRGEMENRKKNGVKYKTSISIAPIFNEAEKIEGFVSTQTDITRLKEIEAGLFRDLHYDKSTGMPNRLCFIKEITRRASKQSGLCAVIFLKIKGLRNYNHNFGFLAGEEIILKTSERLRNIAGSPVCSARIGGSEFAVFLENVVSAKQVLEYSSILKKELEKPVRYADMEFFIAINIGADFMRLENDSPEVILENASIAAEKNSLPDRPLVDIFTSEIRKSSSERIRTFSRLKKAVALKEFEVYYQPVISVSGGEIEEFEALVRWNSPEKGLQSPAAFMDIAEETGIIKEIGQQVFETACRDCAVWNDKRPVHIPVSVNFSARQFAVTDLSQMVFSVIDRSGVLPEDIRIEITETTVMKRMDFVLSVLNKLSSFGIEIMLDDFGTGYSSLSYLKNIPASYIKIDQSLIKEIKIPSDDAQIVKAIIKMVHAVNKKVIAEGVETEEVYRFLEYNLCDCIQGYLFAKPMPLADALRFMEEKPEIDKLIRKSLLYTGNI
ncbi:MAG: putative bifunctional diguanylate cyclase/phosphodiesterase [Fibrobacterota bacterium]